MTTADYRRNGPDRLWAIGTNSPRGLVERIRLDAVYNSRLRFALRYWRENFGFGRVDIEQVGLSVLVDDVRRLGTRARVIAMAASDPLNCLLLYTTDDLASCAEPARLLQSMRRFGPQDAMATACLALPDAFMNEGPVAHRVNSMIDSTFLLYDRVAFPLYLEDAPAFLITVSAYLEAAPSPAPDGHA